MRPAASSCSAITPTTISESCSRRRSIGASPSLAASARDDVIALHVAVGRVEVRSRRVASANGSRALGELSARRGPRDSSRPDTRSAASMRRSPAMCPPARGSPARLRSKSRRLVFSCSCTDCGSLRSRWRSFASAPRTSSSACKSGLLDQVTSVFGRADHLVYLDCKTEEIRTIRSLPASRSSSRIRA